MLWLYILILTVIHVITFKFVFWILLYWYYNIISIRIKLLQMLWFTLQRNFPEYLCYNMFSDIKGHKQGH